MRVSAPLEQATRSIAADWVEIHALMGGPEANEQSLLRSQSVQSEPDHGEVQNSLDPEPADEEILESRKDALSERVYDELSYRESVLGDLYPFSLVDDYGKWSLVKREPTTPAQKAAHDCYTCCLFITAVHSELLPLPTDHDLFKQSAIAMQIAAYLTAAEVIGGKAYWFGFPRPDGSGMLTAIQDLVEKMGTGVAPDKKPPGLSSHAGDGTVDIVAWRSFLDGRHGSVVAYGQVASGRNWKAKPIKAFIDGNFLPWFVKNPSHRYIELLFIPLPQHHELKDGKEDFAGVADEQARLREKNFGVVIDRLRLAELMALSKVSGRYDPAEYEANERLAMSWTEETMEYAAG